MTPSNVHVGQYVMFTSSPLENELTIKVQFEGFTLSVFQNRVFFQLRFFIEY